MLLRADETQTEQLALGTKQKVEPKPRATVML